jgi:small subunit ribosomal protein S3
MGQKVNPIGLRLGINRTWESRWFARKEYGNLLLDDLGLRKCLHKRLGQAGVSRVVIERAAKRTRITLHSARPGVVIGKKGVDIEKLRTDIAKLTNSEVSLNIVEIRKPEIEAKLIADSIAQQLERRVAFRRAMKRAVQSAMRLGAQGIRINCSGRLGGAEIARMEWYREGRVPLHTLRADVDFAYGTAKTTYGVCGVKVWVFKGEILAHDPMAQERRMNEGQPTSHERGRREASDPGRITARQIEAARRAITRHIRRAGRVWIRIFPDVPVSQKPAEVRMGSGKGSPEFWVCRIKPGRIMFELDGVPQTIAREAFALAAAKLPIGTRFVARQGEEIV